MLKRSLLIAGMLLAGAFCVQAQSTCKCTLDDGSHAAATCPAGYMALCACSAASCNSRCVKLPSEPPKRLDVGALVSLLKTTPSNTIGESLSKFYGRNIVFESHVKNFAFDFPPSKAGAGSHWDVLEILAAGGKLTINGHSLDFWKNMRNNLLSGGEITISTGGGTVKTILDEISFISGKRFSLTSGDPAVIINEPVKGKGLSDIIQNLSKIGKVTIVEN